MNDKNLELLSTAIDLIAISIDGSPDLHKAIRQHEYAFTFVERAIQFLTRHNIEYGIAYCVSKLTLEDMPWAVDFAEAHKARLLQFHPYASTGRGASVSDEFGLDDADMARVFLVASLLENSSNVPIQLDILPIKQVQKHRPRYVVLDIESTDDMLLSDLISPIVITDEGNLVPFTYGMNSEFTITQMSYNLADDLRDYKTSRWIQIRDLLDSTFKSLNQHTDGFIDWFHHLSEQSYLINIS